MTEVLRIDRSLVVREDTLQSGERVVYVRNNEQRTVLQSWLDGGVDVHLSAVVGIDEIDSIHVLYYFMDRESFTTVVIGVELDSSSAVTVSLSDLIGSKVYEGEVTEMFGVKFTGNDLQRVFLPDTWDGSPPLLKERKEE